MSDSEEENFCFYGTALEPYDEDSFPKKRPITVEEQIATDQQGRRRFHGAFTGGFSAGFFNTVGSLEGWTPSEFKSSRDEKASAKLQNPEDYMDDEDFSEFGIAPQTVKATSDYAKSKKRKKQVWSDGPIPGEPVLETLINSGNETVGYMLLKNMSLADKKSNKYSEEADKKVYGCEMPKLYEIDRNQEEADLIPAIYKEFLKKPKSNTFGLGYVGLDKSHINLFHSTNLVVKRNNNKKLTISGQAFGVGAFEEEDDEDIYVKEDMEKYDFELTSEKTNKNVSKAEGKTVFDSFVRSKKNFANSMTFPPPVIPHSFTGKHNIRKSRFEPIVESTNVEPKQINPSIRAKYLGESAGNEVYTPSKSVIGSKSSSTSHKTSDESKTNAEDVCKLNEPKKLAENKNIGGFLFDRFVSASQTEDPSNILEPVKRTETLHGTKEMREAARMKMFGPLTRIYIDWTPCSLLCKRFNVPEPNLSDTSSQKNKKRTKNLIFEYQKHEEKAALTPGLTTVQSATSVISASSSAVSKNEVVEMEQSRQNVIIEEESKIKNVEDGLTILDTKIETNNEEVPPKTSIDITEKINVSENKDLFRAIFLSDSESEKEEETEEEHNVQENEKFNRDQVIKENILASELVPKIKTKKDGILSNVDFTQLKSVAENKKSVDDVVEVTSKPTDEDNSVFGPKLPEKIYKLVSIIPTIANDDQWVEKDEVSKKSHHKHKHKNKKEKHKDKTKIKKKHKHKH